MLFGLLKKKKIETNRSERPPRRIIKGTGPKNRPPRLWPPEKNPAEPVESSDSPEHHEVRVDSAAAPRQAPPKAWNSRKPPGGKLPDSAEPPQGSKSA